MNKEIYPFYTFQNGFGYIFISEGIRGAIEKGVLVSPIPDELNFFSIPVYNLGFGDLKLSAKNWALDDGVRTGNGDMPKVIATVARIAMDFLSHHAECVLSFEGFVDEKSALHGKNHRTILYQRAIDSNWIELSAHYTFWGVREGRIEEYCVGRQYDRIFVKNK